MKRIRWRDVSEQFRWRGADVGTRCVAREIQPAELLPSLEELGFVHEYLRGRPMPPGYTAELAFRELVELYGKSNFDRALAEIQKTMRIVPAERLDELICACLAQAKAGPQPPSRTFPQIVAYIEGALGHALRRRGDVGDRLRTLCDRGTIFAHRFNGPELTAYQINPPA